MSQSPPSARSRSHATNQQSTLFRVEVLRLAQQGLSPKVIGIELGTSIHRVYLALERFNWRPRYLSPEEWAYIEARRRA